MPLPSSCCDELPFGFPTLCPAAGAPTPRRHVAGVCSLLTACFRIPNHQSPQKGVCNLCLKNFHFSTNGLFVGKNYVYGMVTRSSFYIYITVYRWTDRMENKHYSLLTTTRFARRREAPLLPAHCPHPPIHHTVLHNSF